MKPYLRCIRMTPEAQAATADPETTVELISQPVDNRARLTRCAVFRTPHGKYWVPMPVRYQWRQYDLIAIVRRSEDGRWCWQLEKDQPKILVDSDGASELPLPCVLP